MNGDWLIRGRDGRLCAYAHAPDGDAVVCRVERYPAGPWTEPRRVGGDQRLHPVLALARADSGYTHLVSWRPTAPGESGLVHSTHFQSHLAALDWSPIGHPNRKGDRTGPVAVTVDAQGRAHVFVRNKGGGVSMRAQAEKGGWDPWQDLRSSRGRGRLVAVTGESGLVTVYNLTPGGVRRFTQREPGGTPTMDDAVLPSATVRPDSLSALATSSGGVTLFYVDEDGGLYAWRGDGAPVRITDAAGDGAPAALRCRVDDVDCTLLAQRARSGRIAFAAYPTEVEDAGAWWSESGDPLPADSLVALAEDAQGRVVAATYVPGGPGRMFLTRRGDEKGLALEAWQRAF
ncbi:hypothetical protein [Streptomyces beihaiensis]|uniref:Uncharacterized protein n=1 Tax=Streptomyces beihaiensis TaxID=2984495 RepID=A0ABT3TZY2_9ACTN|nr:hypothetical protein [Streptomyces beihaiensis]MCX3062579.1 hypothetical protein [Streptomyces beihaiensis]